MSNELFRRLQELKKNIDYHLNNGKEIIEISGGDPGEYEGIPDIIRYIRDNGGTPLLSTNGLSLGDKALAQAVKSAGLVNARIPLYGPYADIHNAVTGNSESFALSIRALKNMEDIGIPVLGQTLILQQNKEYLAGIFSLYKTVCPEMLREISCSIPCIAHPENFEENSDWYVPFKDLPDYAASLKSLLFQSDSLIRFRDIPFCVFGTYHPNIINSPEAPDIGKQLPREELRSKGNPEVPHYRIKVKISICRTCDFNSNCAGFYKNDIDIYGPGNLRPLKK